MLFDDEDNCDYDEELVSADSKKVEFADPRAQEMLIGHADIESNLLDWFQGKRPPHSLILAGPQGIGKSTLAFRLARFLLSQKEDDSFDMFGDAPERAETLAIASAHPAFAQVVSGGHPDLLTVTRGFNEKTEQFKSEVSVDDIRKIPPFMHKTSATGGWRIVIVDDADLMNRNSQNALLKILEEPPKKSLLILIAHRLGALLPTILSRSSVLNMQPLDQNEISAIVKQLHNLSVEELELVSRMANGSLGRAIDYAEPNNLEIIKTVIEFLSVWPRFDWPAIQVFAEKTGGRGMTEQGQSGFQAVMEWVIFEALKTKVEEGAFPIKSLRKMTDDLSLARMIEICDTLRQHFTDVKLGNLDKRQMISGAFMVFENE